MALLRVLLDLREELDAEILAAHLDHAVRPDSAEDAAFVRERADGWEVELVTQRLAPPDPGASASSEAALREARYRFLARVAASRGAAIVAVGHHADDRLETFLSQLVRGAGPRGLSLPRPRREDGVVRPLLERTRREILAYLEELGVPWRADATNEDGSNLRSRLRRDVVPALLRENPGVAASVGRTASLLASVDDLLEGEARDALRALLVAERPGELALDGPRGRLYHPLILSTLLREAARRLGLDPAVLGFDPLDRLVRAWRAGERRVLDPPGDLRVEVGPSAVLVARARRDEPGPAERPLPVPGGIPWPGGLPESPGRAVHLTVEPAPPPADPRKGSGPRIAWLDADRLEGALRVRSRRRGDRYRPLGARGSVKVQDLLVDRKIPRPWRDRIPIVVDSAGILWIPGFRVAERVRLTGRTRASLRLEVAERPPDAAEEPGTRTETPSGEE
jgi:tRNA(Ile)-lysidine synthase